MVAGTDGVVKVGGFGVEERGHSIAHPVPRGGSVAVLVVMKSSSVDLGGVELVDCPTCSGYRTVRGAGEVIEEHWQRA